MLCSTFTKAVIAPEAHPNYNFLAADDADSRRWGHHKLLHAPPSASSASSAAKLIYYFGVMRKLFWAVLAIISAATVFARAWTLPERLTDQDFWKLVNDSSEPGGYFRNSDITNLTSNEMLYQRAERSTESREAGRSVSRRWTGAELHVHGSAQTAHCDHLRYPSRQSRHPTDVQSDLRVVEGSGRFRRNVVFQAAARRPDALHVGHSVVRCV